MLGTTVWFAIVIALVSVALMDTAAAFGRAGVHAAADHAVEPAMHDALADYQNALAADPQATVAGGVPLQRRFAPGAPGTFTLAYSVTPTTVAVPSCAPDAAGAGSDTVAWLQCSGFVRESRMSVHVDVEVYDPAGAELLARRDEDVTLRLFAEPPYSAVVGRTDEAAAGPAARDPLTAPAHEGDVGGDTVSGAVPDVSASPPTGGTLIHVRYECHDGAGSCVNAAPPDPDALRHNATWTNGNQPTP